MRDAVVQLVYKPVEDLAELPHLVLAFDRQALGQVAVSLCDVFQRGVDHLDRIHDASSDDEADAAGKKQGQDQSDQQHFLRALGRAHTILVQILGDFSDSLQQFVEFVRCRIEFRRAVGTDARPR